MLLAERSTYWGRFLECVCCVAAGAIDLAKLAIHAGNDLGYEPPSLRAITGRFLNAFGLESSE